MLQPNSGLGHIKFVVSRSHIIRYARPVEPLWMSDQPVAVSATWLTHNQTDSVRINVTLKRVRVTVVAVENQLSINIFWACIVAIDIHKPVLMRHIINYGLSVYLFFLQIIS
jgi:hypothetical protein